MADTLRLLYTNVNHGRLSSDHLVVTASESRKDIVLVTEPYTPRGRISAPGWKQHVNGSAALLHLPHLVTFPVTTPVSNVVVLRFVDFTIVVAYLSPNDTIASVRSWFQALEQAVISLDGPLLVIGDFNCRTSIIPGVRTDQRGQELEEFLLMTELQTWIPNAPTWVGHNSEGYNDCVLTRGLVLRHARVLVDTPSLSDHRYIELELGSATPPLAPSFRLDKEVLRRAIRDLPLDAPVNLNSVQAVDEYVVRLTGQLQTANDEASVPDNRPKQTVRWWNPELATLKKLVERSFRLLLRSRNDPLRTLILRLIHIELKRKYKADIRAAKNEAWKRFISPRDAWGKPYHLLKKLSQNSAIPALRHPDGTIARSLDENAEILLTSKFDGPPIPDHETPVSRCPIGPPPRVTPGDLTDHIRRLNNRKSPGPDQVSHSMLKILHQVHPRVLPELFTSCLALGYFPCSWRTGRVVFIPKPGKDPTLASSYRPITLLSTVGKMLERVLNDALVRATDEAKALHPAQYGFRIGHSTEEAITHAMESVRRCRAAHTFCVVLSLDIKGAFDNARWDSILLSDVLAHAPHYVWRMLRSYLADRTVTYQGHRRNLDRGCPQGSVLGPFLWNAIHDEVIREISETVFDVVCFADDTLLIVGGDTRPEAEQRSGDALARIAALLARNGLELNTTKTEVLVGFPRWIHAHREQNDDYGIPSVPTPNGPLERLTHMKYLGVIIDLSGRWDRHVSFMVEKCHRILPLLLQLCQNTCGYSPAARRVMVNGAVYSLLHYCSTLFYHTLQTRAHRRLLAALQRKCDRICIQGYRTISGDAAAVLANAPPRDMVLVRRALVALVKRGQVPSYFGPFTRITEIDPAMTILATWRQDLMTTWQRRWEMSDVGPWTHQLFPTIDVRQRTSFQPSFWLTQALSGHGVFGKFLHTFQRRASPRCPCGAEEETAEHVFRFCPRFEEQRPAVWRRPLSDDLIRFLRGVVIDLWRIENPGHRLNV